MNTAQTALKAIVNLNIAPEAPFEGAVLKRDYHGGRSVLLERRADGLYIDGKKLLLGGKHVEGRSLNARLLDFLLANPGFIPYECRFDGTGRYRTCFSGTSWEFEGKSYVRTLYLVGNDWKGGYEEWNGRDLGEEVDTDFALVA